MSGGASNFWLSVIKAILKSISKIVQIRAHFAILLVDLTFIAKDQCMPRSVGAPRRLRKDFIPLSEPKICCMSWTRFLSLWLCKTILKIYCVNSRKKCCIDISIYKHLLRMSNGTTWSFKKNINLSREVLKLRKAYARFCLVFFYSGRIRLTFLYHYTKYPNV